MNIMVDLETLGTTPGCAILSIGAVVFSTSKQTLGEEFYSVVHRESCGEVFLFEEEQTIKWWGDQSPEARVVLEAAMSPEAPHIRDALEEFNRWLKRVGEGQKVYLWGNGADFDNALLAAAYGACKLKPGWPSYNGRCYRSLKSLHGLLGLGAPPALQRGGTHHNALGDAKTQARHAIEIVASLRGALGTFNTEAQNQ